MYLQLQSYYFILVPPWLDLSGSVIALLLPVVVVQYAARSIGQHVNVVESVPMQGLDWLVGNTRDGRCLLALEFSAGLARGRSTREGLHWLVYTIETAGASSHILFPWLST